MRIVGLVAGAALACAVCACAHSRPGAALLMQLDTDFARQADEKGVGPAFSALLDQPQSAMIGPGYIVEGPEGIAKAVMRGPQRGLTWSPDRAIMSDHGDMGVTSGRYVDVSDPARRRTGRYVTIWRKVVGVWKAMMDIDAPDPPR